MQRNIDTIKAAVETLKKDIEELESNFESWDSQSTAGGRRLKSIAERILLSGKRVNFAIFRNSIRKKIWATACQGLTPIHAGGSAGRTRCFGAYDLRISS